MQTEKWNSRRETAKIMMNYNKTQKKGFEPAGTITSFGRKRAAEKDRIERLMSDPRNVFPSTEGGSSRTSIFTGRKKNERSNCFKRNTAGPGSARRWVAMTLTVLGRGKRSNDRFY